MKAITQYNNLMNSICHEHVTIGTPLSEGTENWNLRDMVSEVAYVYELWNNPDSIAYDDGHCGDRAFYQNWRNEITRMKRFIDKYKDEALTMECTESHCSQYD